MINNDTSGTVKSSPREERTETLRNKDFTNPKTLVEWLVLAGAAAEENSQFIINNEEGSDIAKFQEENDFIYRELSNLQPPLFLAERMEEAQRSGNDKEQDIINGLQTTLIQKKDEIERIKKIIEETKISNNENKDTKKSSVIFNLVKLKASLKKKKRESQIININDINLSMNGNQKVIKNVKKLLAVGKEALEKNDKNAEVEELLKQVDQALQQTDDNNLKAECDKLCSELEDEKNKNINNGVFSSVWLRHYLDSWYVEDTANELTPEQEEKLKKAEEVEKERDELKNKVEELEKQGGGVGVDDEAKKKLEKEINNFLTACNIDDDELTSALSLEDETWRVWVGKIDTPYDLAYRYGEIRESIARINASKEKEKLEKKIAEKDEEIEKKKEQIEEMMKSPGSVPPTPSGIPDERKEMAQKWLEENYGENKEDIYEIIANNRSGVKLTGKLEIKDYPNLDTIFLEEMEVTELIIENCPNVERIEAYGGEITKIVGLEHLPELKKLDCGLNQISKLDISKNLKLRTLVVRENQPDMEIIGLKKLSNLVSFSGDKNASIDLLKVTKEELEEAASKLGVDEKKLENKSPEEIKEMIEKEGKKIKKNKDKIDGGLPGLLNQENEVDDDKLTEISEKMTKVKELEEEIEKMQKEMGKVVQKVKDYEVKIITTREKLGETEQALKRQVGSEEWEDVKKKIERRLKAAEKNREKLQANVEVNDNNKQ